MKKPKAEKPTRKGAAFVMQNASGAVFLCKRPDQGLLASMTQIPTTDWNARQDGNTESNAAPVSAIWKNAGVAKHAFTHFHLELTVWRAAGISDVPLDGWWCKTEKLADEALPTVMRKVIDLALK